MRVSSPFAVALLALTFLAGCDSRNTHEAIAEDMVGKMRQMVDVLKGVTDEATAKAAKPKMDTLKKDIDALKAKGDTLGKPSADAKSAGWRSLSSVSQRAVSFWPGAGRARIFAGRTRSGRS